MTQREIVAKWLDEQYDGMLSAQTINDTIDAMSAEEIASIVANAS